MSIKWKENHKWLKKTTNLLLHFHSLPYYGQDICNQPQLRSTSQTTTYVELVSDHKWAGWKARYFLVEVGCSLLFGQSPE